MSGTHKAIEAVWKIESTRLIAGIARVTRDIGIAEELAQGALVAALERWPAGGNLENPAAWLMTAAKRRAIDALRRGRMLDLKHGEIARDLELKQQRLGEAMDRALDQVIDDDVLRLIFTACHPALAVEGRVALTLRLACGLTTAEIARSFLCRRRRWASASSSQEEPVRGPCSLRDAARRPAETSAQVRAVRGLRSRRNGAEGRTRGAPGQE